MTTTKKIIILGLISGLFGLSNCTDNKETTKKQINKDSKMKTIPFQTQLEIFQSLGFILNEGTYISDIDRWEDRSEFEKEPFSLMYMTLGQTIEREPWTPLTNKCWDFDTEAIEGNGSYIRIIENLQRITSGELKFENIKDFVDLENGNAWVSFTINGDKYKWDMKVEDDWVDTELFSKVVDLTNKYQTKGKYTYYDTGGQNAVIGYETPTTLKEITEKTELEIEWLE